MCTLHSFPHNIDHCLTFARSEFEGLLEKAQTEANAYLSDTAKYLSAIRSVSSCLCLVQAWSHALCCMVKLNLLRLSSNLRQFAVS